MEFFGFIRIHRLNKAEKSRRSIVSQRERLSNQAGNILFAISGRPISEGPALTLSGKPAFAVQNFRHSLYGAVGQPSIKAVKNLANKQGGIRRPNLGHDRAFQIAELWHYQLLTISTPNHLSKLDYAQFRYIVDAYAVKLVGPK
jgi:hypothetical protein